MSRVAKIFAVIAVVGGILALSLGSIAFAAEPNTPAVCDETGAMTRLHAQDATCVGTCEDPLQTRMQERIQLGTGDCAGECADPLKTQTHTRLQLATCVID